MNSNDLSAVREHFQRFATGKAAGYSPTYAVLAAHIASQDELLEIAANAQVSTIADLFMFAVQYLVRRKQDRALLPLFDFGLAEHGTDAAVSSFTNFCIANRQDLTDILRTSRLQTNEPGRSAALLIGLLETEKVYGGPLHLVDLGTSAGLHLMLDQLSYVFEAEDGRSAKLEATAHTNVLRAPLCQAKLYNWASRELPSAMPEIVGKIGIELSPLDVRVTDNQLRLESCVWPEEGDRRSFMRSVIELAALSPPEIRSGDVAAELPAVLDALPRDGVLCVINSHAVGQFPQPVVEAIDSIVSPLIATGGCVKLSLEGRRGGELAVPQHAPAAGTYAQLRMTGARGVQSILLAGSHGGWIEAL
ncbi:MAG TPA: DUF2332 domain-containing protein [Acidobacteriaceae bacterium]|nr:DUF2332 domain-containing protein [Acidobacteriaceae bacterium]